MYHYLLELLYLGIPQALLLHYSLLLSLLQLELIRIVIVVVVVAILQVLVLPTMIYLLNCNGNMKV